MKVLLVNPPMGFSYYSLGIRRPPLGLAYLDLVQHLLDPRIVPVYLVNQPS